MPQWPFSYPPLSQKHRDAYNVPSGAELPAPLPGNSAVPFSQLDSASIARALSRIADEAADVADAFFERREDVELRPDGSPGLRVWREEGFAVRLMRQENTWLAARDGLTPELFRDALKRVARAMPRLPISLADMDIDPWPGRPEAEELQAFPSAVARAVKAHHLSFHFELTVRRHRRWVRTTGTRLASASEAECFYSVVCSMPWGRTGALFTDLRERSAESLAASLARSYHAREAPPPDPYRGVLVLGHSATAVLLHEAVAHALEADILARSGNPEAAIGVAMGSPLLNVFDDPSSAPKGVRRTSDDEGCPVMRRCLLRAGVVEQPLCDTTFARHSERLSAGAGRRGSRHWAPTPRSFHLELAPGETTSQDLVSDAEGGLYLPEADRGYLDPISGTFTLHFPYGRRIRHRVPEEPVGPCTLKARVGDLLDRVTGVGADVHAAGAGWCAKGGVKLPVWATSPELRLEGLEITS